jgi:hypothetical protein
VCSLVVGPAQGEQPVDRVDVVRAEADGFLLRAVDHGARAFVEPFEHREPRSSCQQIRGQMY